MIGMRMNKVYLYVCIWMNKKSIGNIEIVEKKKSVNCSFVGIFIHNKVFVRGDVAYKVQKI